MGKINFAKDANGNKYYPVTVGDAVAVKGKTLTKALEDIEEEFSEQEELINEGITKAEESARDAANNITELKSAIQNLPDGQAVSAQVAKNTVSLGDLSVKVSKIIGDARDVDNDFKVMPNKRYITSGGVLSSSYNDRTYSIYSTVGKNEKYHIEKMASNAFRVGISNSLEEGTSVVLLHNNASVTSIDIDTGDNEGYLIIYCCYNESDEQAVYDSIKVTLTNSVLNDVKELKENMEDAARCIDLFDSGDSPTSSADLDIADEEGNVIARFFDGHFRTKNFDSRNLSTNEIESRYFGKVVSILGDSISTYGDPSSTNKNGTYCYSYYPTATCRYSADGVDSIPFDVNDTWWMRLINKCGMVLGVNDSWRSMTVSTARGVDGSLSNQNRINHLGENGTPDLILVYGGTNDAGVGVTLGTFNTDNPMGYTNSQIAALPVTNFADAYRTMLIRLLKTYPTSEIVVILPTFTTSYYTITNLDLYVEVIKEACDFFGIKYIDIRVSGINIFNKDSYLEDGIHPNAEGMRLLFEKIYRQLIYS